MDLKQYEHDLMEQESIAEALADLMEVPEQELSREVMLEITEEHLIMSEEGQQKVLALFREAKEVAHPKLTQGEPQLADAMIVSSENPEIEQRRELNDYDDLGFDDDFGL